MEKNKNSEENTADLKIPQYKDLKFRKLPYFSSESFLIKYFLILGYEEETVKHEIKKKVYEKIIQKFPKEKKTLSERLESNKFYTLRLESRPTVLANIPNMRASRLISESMIIKLIFPSPPSIYYCNKNLTDYECGDSCVIFLSSPDLDEKEGKNINFGFGLIFYEKFVTSEGIKIFTPKVFCFISQFPFFSTFHALSKKIFTSFFKNENEMPLEILLFNLVNFTPSSISQKISLIPFPNKNLREYARLEEKDFQKDYQKDFQKDFQKDNQKDSQKDFQLTMTMTSASDSNELSMSNDNSSEKSDDIKVELGEGRKKKPSVYNNITQIKQLQIQSQSQIEIERISGYPIFDFNLTELFKFLKPELLIEIFLYSFLEVKILLFSKNLEALSILMYSISFLSYPLTDTPYIWQILSVSMEDLFEKKNNNFVYGYFSNMVGVNCTYEESKETTSKLTSNLSSYFIVDLEARKAEFFYNEKEKTNKEIEEIYKIFQVSEYIKKILKRKLFNKSSPLEMSIQNLLTKLTAFVTVSESPKEEVILPNFFETNPITREKTKKIQEIFYNFVLSILHTFYKKYKLKSKFEIQQSEKQKLEKEKENELKEALESFEKKNAEKRKKNPSAENFKLVLKEKLEEHDMIIGIENKYADKIKNLDQDFKSDFLLFLEKEKDNVSEEENLFNEIFQDTFRYGNFKNFLEEYKADSTHFSSFLISEEFLNLKSLNLDLSEVKLFDIIDKFYKKTGGSEQLHFGAFYAYYENNMRSYFCELIKDSSNVKIIRRKLNNLKRVEYYNYISANLDNKILWNYGYLLLNMREEELKAFFQTYLLNEENKTEVNFRDIENAVEICLYDSKKITFLELVVAAALLILGISAEFNEHQILVIPIIDGIAMKKYVYRKYLTFLISIYYRLSVRKLEKGESFKYELTNYYLLINILRVSRLLPTKGLKKLIEDFSYLNSMAGKATKSPPTISFPDKADFRITVLNKTCKHKVDKDICIKCAENACCQGDLEYECPKCGKKIQIYLSLSKIEGKKEVHILETKFFSCVKVFNETLSCMKKFFPNLDSKNVNKELLKTLIVNIMFFLSQFQKNDRAIADFLFRYLNALLNP